MRNTNEDRSFTGNLRWGIRWGVFIAAAFACMAAVPALLRFVTRMNKVNGHAVPPFLHLVALYIVAGISAGLIAGTLRPLLRWWLGRRVVAMLATVPASFALDWSMYPDAAWHARNVESILGFAAVYGFMMSFAFGDWPFGPNPGKAP